MAYLIYYHRCHNGMVFSIDKGRALQKDCFSFQTWCLSLQLPGTGMSSMRLNSNFYCTVLLLYGTVYIMFTVPWTTVLEKALVVHDCRVVNTRKTIKYVAHKFVCRPASKIIKCWGTVQYSLYNYWYQGLLVVPAD